jgi:heterodisulfide reductase subunit A
MNADVQTASTADISGAVLVVGGGVAGVQTALDLTELSYKVYLLGKSGTIGGVMARLDKTFPTNPHISQVKVAADARSVPNEP